MNRRTRLIFLAISFIALLIVGRWITHSFYFTITQFWFTSGLFLLILLSLIDQPNFSKDSNIFINSVTAWMSLILVAPTERDWIWWTFFSFTTYLITSSYVLIWIRKKELKDEHFLIAFITRVNREIGKPEAIFSTFFIWGAVRQFEINTVEFDALLTYWMVFMILNMPAFASALNKIFEPNQKLNRKDEGNILKLIDPRVAEVLLPTDFANGLIGREVTIHATDKEKIGDGVFIDERIISGSRIGKVVVTATTEKWKSISDTSKGKSFIQLASENPNKEKAISVVDKGSTIDNLIFYLNPSIKLQEGEITYVQIETKLCCCCRSEK